MKYPILYRTIQVDGLSIFYREAGRRDAPTILFLHGLPSSSRMFQPLLTRLADDYHLVAPDYPGFGHSDWPDPTRFAYTFDNVASVMTASARLMVAITRIGPIVFGSTCRSMITGAGRPINCAAAT